MKKLKKNNQKQSGKGQVKAQERSKLSSIVYLDGKFVPAETAKVSVFDHGFLYGDGVYETLRMNSEDMKTEKSVVKKKAVSAGVRQHLKRLRKSAKAVKIIVPWSDATLEKAILELVRRNGFERSKVRVTVTRGRNEYEFTTCKKPTLCIVATHLPPEPARVYTQGVDIITVRAERTLPEVKSLNFLPLIYARQMMKKHKAYEALYVDCASHVREGTTTNFFLVKQGALVTPKEKILQGTTRRTVLQMAKKSGMRVEEREVSLKELLSADEIFLTNTLKGVVPVRSVDGKRIGNKKTGGKGKQPRFAPL